VIGMSWLERRRRRREILQRADDLSIPDYRIRVLAAAVATVRPSNPFICWRVGVGSIP
jgi:hypothetical protein